MTQLLLETCLPLAALIGLGFIVGKLHTVDLKSIATIAIYAITPLVAFCSAARLEFTPALILLPVCTFLMAAFVGLASYATGKMLGDRTQRSLLPVACGSGNTGYFGLPLAIALFGEENAGIYFLANLGVVIFETSIGFYFIARGNLSTRDALKRVAKLPVLYALTAGLVLAAMAVPIPEFGIKLWTLCKGAYVVIGMMIAGIALAQSDGFKLDGRLTFLAFGGKFLLWPLVAITFSLLLPNLFEPIVYQLIIVLSVVPIAANLPAFAAANNAPVREAAMLVLVSTIFAIILLPIVLPLLL